MKRKRGSTVVDRSEASKGVKCFPLEKKMGAFDAVNDERGTVRVRSLDFRKISWEGRNDKEKEIFRLVLCRPSLLAVKISSFSLEACILIESLRLVSDQVCFQFLVALQGLAKPTQCVQ